MNIYKLKKTNIQKKIYLKLRNPMIWQYSSTRNPFQKYAKSWKTSMSFNCKTLQNATMAFTSVQVLKCFHQNLILLYRKNKSWNVAPQ